MQEILRHRQVLVAACAGVAFSIAAIPPFVLSVFAGPMTREFGWTLQQFQWATFAVPLGVLIAAPVGGWLLDRYGPRRVALVGLAAFGASVAGLALSTAEPWTFYLAMLVLSVAAAGRRALDGRGLVDRRVDAVRRPDGLCRGRRRFRSHPRR
jgi:MFS family permease